MLGPKRRTVRAFVRPPAVATLPRMRGPLEALLDDCAVVRAELRVLSLFLDGGGYLSTFGRCGRNLGQIFRELPKISEVATNH